MPKKAVPTKTPSKTLDLDKKIDAIKTLNEEIQEEKHPEPEPEPVPVAKKQPKIIEEVIEEEDPEPVIIRKIIKKKPKQIIEEVVEEESEPEEARTEEKPKPKKKDGRGRPFGSVKKPKEVIPQEQSQRHNIQQQQTYGRNRFDTMLDDSNLELLRQEMKNEMKRRLMSSLFD